jgi:hypothetical protein
MAYAATITWHEEQQGKARRLNLWIVETGAGASDFWTTLHSATNSVDKALNPENCPTRHTVPVPHTFVVRHFKQDIISGTGTTVRGMIGGPSTPGTFTADTMDMFYRTSAAAGFINEASLSTLGFKPDRVTRILSGTSAVNAGSDNVIHTHLIIDSGL